MTYKLLFLPLFFLIASFPFVYGMKSHGMVDPKALGYASYADLADACKSDFFEVNARLCQSVLDGALFEAIDQKSLDSVKKFVALGADVVNAKTGDWPGYESSHLRAAIHSGSLDIVTCIVGEMVNKTKKHVPEIISQEINRAGWSLLHVAASLGYLDIVKWLLDNGADVNAQSSRGETALSLAVSRITMQDQMPEDLFGQMTYLLVLRGAQCDEKAEKILKSIISELII